MPLIAVGVLAAAVFKEWNDDVFLHGSSILFREFSPGPHGLTYLSDPRKSRRRKTQAESISLGPFGGYLYEVRVLDGKRFDPLNDPAAREIALEVIGRGSRGHRSENERLAMIHYSDAPALAKLASQQGYTHLEIYEPSVGGWSLAITDPALLQIIAIHDVSGQR